MSLLIKREYQDAEALTAPVSPSTSWRTALVYTPSYTRSIDACSDQPPTSQKKWNAFAHYRYRCEPPLSAIRCTTSVDWNFQGGWIRYSLPARAGWSWGGSDAWGLSRLGNSPIADLSVDGTDFVPDPPELSDLLARALRDLAPTVKSELSLLNSLYELKDFKTLLPFARRIKSGLDNVAGLVAWIYHPDRKAKIHTQVPSTLRGLTKLAAESHLQTQFNFRPLLSDIKGLFKAFKRYQAQALRLMSNANKARIAHRKMKIEFPDENTEFHLGPYSVPVYTEYTLFPGRFEIYPTTGAAASCSARSTLRPVQFHVEMEYSYDYSAFQARHAELFAALDSLGVNFDPSIIWNAIPWTFVVDWVVGVSQYLEQFKRRNLEPQTHIRRALWSVTYSREVNLSVSWGETQNAPVASIREDSYKRVPFVPDYAPLRAGGLNLREIGLGAALVITRPKHRKLRKW